MSVLMMPYISEMKGMLMGDELMDILDNGKIRTEFQPIVSLKDGSVLGYEALSRGPQHSPLEKPGVLFDIARVYGKLWELEFLCRFTALESLSGKACDFHIFLNVDPHIIHDEKFRKGFTREFLKQFQINPANIVFEITEKNSITDMESFRKIVENYKEQGYKIAIDDVGAGYSGLKLITDIRPQFIKLDMTLIRDIDKNGLKHALIKTFYDFCTVADIKLIAEGIETENELCSLINIGINYGQGYFIQRPSPDIAPIRPELIEEIKSRNRKKEFLYRSRPQTVPVGDICRTSITIHSAATGAEALEIFNANPALYGIPVVSEDKLVGLLMKDKFFAKLGTQYGFALYLNRPVTLLMDKKPLAVEYDTTIDIVSGLAMARNDESLYDYIIVTKNNDYHGIITVKDLLEKSTQLEVSFAKHLNPLSGLPGNILIEDKLKECINSESPFTILYIDLDNFKVYNDVYGFENGDRVIQFVARIITEAASAVNNSGGFIGHIGGDDFVLVVDSWDVDDVDDICKNIIFFFEKGITEFYTEEDLQRKYIISRNRRGEEEQYGLLTISISGVSNKIHRFQSVYQLTEYAGRVKKKCKQIWNNCYCIE